MSEQLIPGYPSCSSTQLPSGSLEKQLSASEDVPKQLELSSITLESGSSKFSVLGLRTDKFADLSLKIDIDTELKCFA